MSSRAAAGRKRLTGGDKDEKRSPTSPKGFLSRFKSAKAVNAQTAHESEPPFFHADSATPTTYQPQDVLVIHSPQETRSSPNNEVPHRHFDSAPHGFLLEDTQAAAAQYIEASYQPPPPAVTTYQAPPPVSPTRPQSRRPLPVAPQAVILSSSSVETFSEIPAPPSYASPIPTRSALPFSSSYMTNPSFNMQSSSSTRTNSPTPTYSSVAIHPSVHALPRLQVPNHNFSRKDRNYNRYNQSSPSYLPSTSSQPIVLTYTPLPESTQSTPLDNRSRQSWEQGSTGSQASRPTHPERPNSVVSGPPKSTSGSSDSSRRSVDPVAWSMVPTPGSMSTLSSGSKSPAVSIKGGGSGSINSPVPPSGYVFPVGRSRAQPSKPSTISRNIFDKGKAVDDADARRKARKFMGISFKKKKSRQSVDPQIESNATSPGLEPAEDETLDPQLPDMPEEEVPETEESLDIPSEENTEFVPITESRPRLRASPFDPFNPTILESDLYTAKLLSKLCPTGSPTFYNYGNTPPTSVLDLGCGQGYWIIDAAMSWKGYGTKVIGCGIVDISNSLLSRSIEQGILENVSFVQRNFLEESLPFGDESFDLVRMSCLTLSVTSQSWLSVLQEVHRVLMPGGRLELIDDVMVFPYSMPPSPDGQPVGHEHVAPHLNISIPSASLSRTSSIYDVGTRRSMHMPTNNAAGQDFLDLGPVEEEGDADDTRTINGPDLDRLVFAMGNPVPRNPRSSGISLTSWNNGVDSSRNLEGLFDHMLLYAFDIRTDSGDFVPPLLNEVFGYAREMHALHLSSPSPFLDPGSDGSGAGLVVLPSTFLPMEPTDITIHATRYPRLLLSCKDALVEYAIDVMDSNEVDEASVLDALKDYEEFLPYRLGLSHSPSHRRTRSSRRGTTGTPAASEEIPSASGASPVSFLNASNSVNLPESNADFVHIRSFRIYEALKVDRALFTTT